MRLAIEQAFAFNTSKVQLKPEAIAEGVEIPDFQYLKGAIEAALKDALRNDKVLTFNTSKVQLKPGARAKVVGDRIALSIPQRCN